MLPDGRSCVGSDVVIKLSESCLQLILILLNIKHFSVFFSGLTDPHDFSCIQYYLLPLMVLSGV